MTGFLAGAGADAASKMPEKTVISKTLAQLDKIFGEAATSSLPLRHLLDVLCTGKGQAASNMVHAWQGRRVTRSLPRTGLCAQKRSTGRRIRTYADATRIRPKVSSKRSSTQYSVVPVSIRLSTSSNIPIQGIDSTDVMAFAFLRWSCAA